MVLWLPATGMASPAGSTVQHGGHVNWGSCRRSNACNDTYCMVSNESVFVLAHQKHRYASCIRAKVAFTDMNACLRVKDGML